MNTLIKEVADAIPAKHILFLMDACYGGIADIGFSSLRKIVLDCRSKGLDPLWVYDTTVRIGICRKKYPKAVYFHRGSKEGARALEIMGHTRSRWVA